MQEYTHNYRGIIVQNDDPEKMGRVKVWVPHVNLALYEKWNKDRDNDKKFTYPGANLGSSLTPEILLRLKIALPWAQVKHPIFGMGTSITYNADNDYAEISNDSQQSNQSTVINTNTSPDDKIQGLVDRITGTDYLKPPTPSTINEPMESNPADSLGYMSAATAPTPPSDSPKIPTPKPTTTSSTETSATDNIERVAISVSGHGGNPSRIGVFFSSSSEGSTPLSGKITGLSGATHGATQLFNFSAPLTYTQGTTPNAKYIGVDVISPNGQKISTSAAGATYDGSSLSLIKNGSPILIPKEQINGIGVAVTNPNTSVDFSSSRLGGLSKLLGEYQTTPKNTVVLPPALVSAPSHNTGGGGGEMFGLANSKFLLPASILNNAIGGVNPSSKQGSNYGRRMPASVDPQKTVGVNQTLPADTKPPMLSNTQSNKVKGVVSIPAVGAHVSVYFENGDPLYPIIDGVFYTQEDFAGVHDVS